MGKAYNSMLRILILMLVASAVAFADAPLGPPEKFTVRSPDGKISAISDPEASSTKITRTDSGQLLWEIPGWRRSQIVANDGKHVVTGYGGMNLIPVNYNEYMIVFTFWREGKKIREVTLKEFIIGKSPPRRTVSHYNWGSIEKLDSDGRLVVRDSDRQRIYRYSLETGLEVR
jgi:hypothetical protein